MEFYHHNTLLVYESIVMQNFYTISMCVLLNKLNHNHASVTQLFHLQTFMDIVLFVLIQFLGW